MKGVIFTLKRRRISRGFSGLRLPGFSELKTFFSRRGSLLFFLFAVTSGLVLGSVCVSGFDEKTLKALDFLFTTNLPEKLKGGFAGAFFASFASGFLFLSAAVFCSLSLFGAVCLPFIAFFKGFGIGVSAAYLVMNYGVKGALFYLFVILPGVFVFTMILVYELSAGLSFNKKMLLNILKGNTYPLKGALTAFLKRSLKYLAGSLAAALGDAVLWFLLSGLFR